MFFMSERLKEVTVRNEQTIFSPTTGEKVGKRRRVFADMKRGYVPEWAVEIAEKTFTMGGKPPDVPLHRWIATYDSVLEQQLRNWTDEEREMIEAKLLSQGDVVLIEQERLAAPYKKYDQHRKIAGRRQLEHVLADIREAYENAGFDVDKAIAYERQNLNDSAVIEALEGLRPVAEVEEPEALTAA